MTNTIQKLVTVNECAELDISAGGGGKGLLGDINGDGCMELVIVRADDRDTRYIPHQVTCITAFRLTGEMLWQRGVKEGKAGGFGSDFPAQICDIDGDGKLEVLCIMDGKFLVLDGADGTVKAAHELPDPEAHDCIIIANLTGRDAPRDIILKDRYHRLWAYDADWNLLWTHEGNVGHFPWPSDINGDGYDEVMAGYDLLDHTGKVLWSCHDLEEHADCLWVGDVNGDGFPEIAVGGSVTCLYDRFGKELWRYDGSIESQHIALGHFLPGEPGLQTAGLDRIRRGDGYKGQWDGRDGMFMLDNNGHELWKEDRKTKGWLTIVETLSGWNGEDRDYILAYRRGGGVNPTLYNGSGEAVITFSRDGYVLHGDLFGRGKEDIIIYGADRAWIYSGTPVKPEEQIARKPVPQPIRLSRSTLYPGGEYMKSPK